MRESIKEVKQEWKNGKENKEVCVKEPIKRGEKWQNKTEELKGREYETDN